MPKGPRSTVSAPFCSDRRSGSGKGLPFIGQGLLNSCYAGAEQDRQQQDERLIVFAVLTTLFPSLSRQRNRIAISRLADRKALSGDNDNLLISRGWNR